LRGVWVTDIKSGLARTDSEQVLALYGGEC